MSRMIDLTGRKFCRLLVLAAVGARTTAGGQRKTTWQCLCECGSRVVVDGCSLKTGGTKSCGCLKHDRSRAMLTKHGHRSGASPSQTYSSWRGMIGRCTDTKHVAWKYYGGRGITVCDRWRDFRRFLEDMGERPPCTTIDRINGNGNYCKDNCEWTTQKQQTRHTRRNVTVTLGTETRCLSEWIEILGLNAHTVRDRVRRGWSPDRALTERIHR
jgi:hypothetical protein